MARTESKIETLGTWAMLDNQGGRHTVTVRATYMRAQYADGTWSNWTQSRMRFTSGRWPVNPLGDGQYEQLGPSATPLRLTVAPGQAAPPA